MTNRLNLFAAMAAFATLVAGCGGSKSCDPAVLLACGTQSCSAKTKTCVDDKNCAADADCPDGFACGGISKVCARNCSDSNGKPTNSFCQAGNICGADFTCAPGGGGGDMSMSGSTDMAASPEADMTMAAAGDLAPPVCLHDKAMVDCTKACANRMTACAEALCATEALCMIDSDCMASCMTASNSPIELPAIGCFMGASTCQGIRDCFTACGQEMVPPGPMDGGMVGGVCDKAGMCCDTLKGLDKTICKGQVEFAVKNGSDAACQKVIDDQKKEANCANF